MTDHIGRYVTTDHLAISVVRATDTCNTIAAQQHELHGEPLAILSRAIVGSLALATRLKGVGVLIFQQQGKGLFDFLRVDAIGLGSVRAMITESTRDNLQSWNGVDTLLSDGHIQVSKQIENTDQPYVSSIASRFDDLPHMFNEYVQISEQVDAALLIDVRSEGAQVREATGVYLERLPDAAEDALSLQHLKRHQESLEQMAAPGLAGDQDDQGLLNRLLPGSELIHLRDYDAGFHCPCSRERFASTLKGIANDQLSDLAVDGVINCTCDFCRTNYPIPLDEVL